MLLLSILYFFTRIFFLRNYPAFYDSFEYLRLAQKIEFNNLVKIITDSHQPIHTFYFLTVLAFKKILFFLSANSVLVGISFIFGYLTIVSWYLLVREVLNKKYAFISSLFVLIFPYFLVVNTNILYESELLFFQILSIFLFTKGLKKYNRKNIFLAGISYGLAQLIFIGNLFLLPIFLIIFITNKNRLWFFLIIFLIGSLIITLFIDYLILGIPLLITKYHSHLLDIVSTNQGLLITTLRILRNILFQSVAILALSGFLFLLMAIILGLFKNKQQLSIYLLWLLPVIVLMQYWHAGFFGRLSIFLVFPSSLIMAKFLNNKKVVLIALFFISLTTLYYAFKQKELPAIYVYFNLLRDFKKDNLAILTSDYNRFIFQENNYSLFIFNGLGQNQSDAERFILRNLNRKKRVIIDSAALEFPYYQFDGNFYHILSLRKVETTLAKSVLKKFEYKPFRADNKNKRIFFLEIIKPKNVN